MADAEVDANAESHESPAELPLRELIEDGLVGALGGLIGVGPLTIIFMLLSQVGAFSLTEFRQLADVLRLAVDFSPATAQLLGYVVFVLGAMVTWPLVLASIGTFFPGERYATRGLFLGAAIWTGFALAWYDGFTGGRLVLYLVATFLGHLLYGYLLGATFDKLFGGNRPHLAPGDEQVV
ncbi:DUF6789 family protein [Halosegnis sp.]|uniref:DUF6789 family protein n=1 Tax=Halosegnis sp. TaxID=2864959 RepID=UPI0035D4934A